MSDSQRGTPFECTPDSVTLRKHDGRWWPMSCIQEGTAGLPKWNGLDRLSIGGPGAVWMYAYLGARAGAARVRSLEVLRPERMVALLASELAFGTDSPTACARKVPAVITRDGEGPRLFLQLDDLPYGSDYKAVAPELHAAIRPGDEVVITGRGSVDLYAALGYASGLAGASRVLCLLPPEGMALIPVYGTGIGHAEPLPDWVATRISHRAGATYGVIGFPNSGKSVLSKLIAAALRGDVARGMQPVAAWNFDADPASPTPDWYLEMIARGDGAGAKSTRDRHKVQWTDELQDRCADRLASARVFFDRVIVDLPGGDHRNKQNPDLIPHGREKLFAEVDRFIIINLRERDSARQWIDVLRQKGMSERVHAVIDSVEHLNPTALSLDFDATPVAGVAKGLDRNAVRTLTGGGGLLPAAGLSDALLRDLRRLVGVA